MPTEARGRLGILESDFLFQLTSGYVKDGRDEIGIPNTHRYRECVGYAARAAMFLALGNAKDVGEYLEKARSYTKFTKERVPELDIFIKATAAKAAFTQGIFQEANKYAQEAQEIALTLNGTTSEMRDYLEYVIELSLQIADHQAGS